MIKPHIGDIGRRVICRLQEVGHARIRAPSVELFPG
jgi:hypothetical protein